MKQGGKQHVKIFLLEMRDFPSSEDTWKEARERKTVEVKSWMKADGTPEGNGDNRIC